MSFPQQHGFTSYPYEQTCVQPGIYLNQPQGIYTNRLWAQHHGCQANADCESYGSTDSRCETERSASTPPPSPQPCVQDLQMPEADRAAQPVPAPLPMQEVLLPSGMKQGNRSSSRVLQQHERFHQRAISFVPASVLPSHRYWIAVLNLDRKLTTIANEKHFTWMKANRMTTVRTIWHAYHVASMEEDFSLLLGNEALAMEDRAEELDFFNDKLICLRAVRNGSVETRKWTDDIVAKDVSSVVAQ